MNTMMLEDEAGNWAPATIEHVLKILHEDLGSCDSLQRATFAAYSVPLRFAPIERYGQMEQVVIVAQREQEAIYWEDVELGFNLSPLGADGRILEHWCNQDELGYALNAWIDGRERSAKFGPAVPIS
jgi:hypothetical protein